MTESVPDEAAETVEPVEPVEPPEYGALAERVARLEAQATDLTERIDAQTRELARALDLVAGLERAIRATPDPESEEPQ